MAEPETLARPYARAAFELAREEGNEGLDHGSRPTGFAGLEGLAEEGNEGLDRWSRLLSLLAAVVREETIASALASPTLTAEGKAGLIAQLLGDDLFTAGQNFVQLLADNKRLELAPEIASLYEALKGTFLRTLEVEVISARELAEADLSALSGKLAARFDRQVMLTSRVDPGLLGGAMIRAGDTVIDGSIRGRLDRLAYTLRPRA